MQRGTFLDEADISKVETEDLLRTLMLINSRPRKCWNCATPLEKLLHEIKFEEIWKMLHLILQFRVRIWNFMKRNFKKVTEYYWQLTDNFYLSNIHF